MSTRTTAARRSVVTGLLALALLGGTAATGVGVTAAAAAGPAASVTQVPTTSKTSDFGYLTKISRTSKGTSLVLDRAIMYTGREAAAQRARRGLEPVPEYYIQNDNPKLRTFRVRSDVKVYGSQQLTGSPPRKPISLAALQRYVKTAPKATRAPFTLKYDRQGRVVEIAEFYLP
jgi:hypothetical protein